MFESAQHRDAVNTLGAFQQSLAMIEFATDGTILSANAKFLAVVGYELYEIKGKSHRIFLEDGAADKNEYEEFWHHLRSGEAKTGE